MIGMMSETPSWRSTLRSFGVEKRAIDVTERNVGAEGRSVEDQHPVDTAQIINGFKLKPSRQQANGLRRPFHATFQSFLSPRLCRSHEAKGTSQPEPSTAPGSAQGS